MSLYHLVATNAVVTNRIAIIMVASSIMARRSTRM